MNRICCRCFIVEVDGIEYIVKFGKIDEFICLFLPSVVIVKSMTQTAVSWSHEFQWYKPI